VTTENASKGPGQSFEGEAESVVDAPPSKVRLKANLSDEDFRAFLARKDAQKRIREVVVKRLHKKAPTDLVEDITQQANVDALAARSRPQSMETALGWLGTVSARAVVNHFRRNAVHEKWLKPDVDVEELPPEPDGATGPFAPPSWLLTDWLRPRVAGDPREQETYELLVYKANTGKTHAQVALDHGMSEGALKSRIHALKTKYEPEWRRRQRMVLMLLLFGAALAIVVLAWLLWLPGDPPLGQDVPPRLEFLDHVFGEPPLPVTHPPPEELLRKWEEEERLGRDGGAR
jgi:DNA-directed RNA polymerase specialized sigma24 family protein